MDSYRLTHSLSVFFLLGVSGGWQVLRRTPFASLTPAPPTIYYVPLRGTRILRAPPPARVRGWTRPRNTCHPPSSHMTKKEKALRLPL